MSCCTSRWPSMQTEQPFLRLFELHVGVGDVLPIDVEDQVEAGDLLFDQAPLVHPARAFEQQRLGIDPHQEVLIRPHAGLEVEGALRSR